MIKAHTRTTKIAGGIVLAIVVAIGLSPVSSPFSPGSLIAAVGAGFLGYRFSETLLNAVLRILGRAPGTRGSPESGEIGFGTRRETDERDARQSWLDAENHKHHKHLVDLFFAQLKSLRVAPSSRRPFHLDLFMLNLPAQGLRLPIDGSLSSLPLREESVSHLAAVEYSSLSGTFGSLINSVAGFNAKADRVISSVDLEGMMKRMLPNLRNESEGRALTWGNYYYSGNLWLALERTVQSAEIRSEIKPSGANLERMMPWAAGYKLVIGGYTVAHMKELGDLEALQKLINGSTRELRELIAEREAVQLRLEAPTRAFGEELRRLLEDYNVRQRLFGRCHVEESLEEQVKSDQS